MTYQDIVNSSFRQSLTYGDGAAAAMLAFAEFAQLILFMLIGCFIGIIFAAISLRVQRRVLGLGLAGIIFNGVPLLLLLSFLVKGWTVGI